MSTPTRLDAETTLWSRWQGSLLFVFQREADPQTGAFPPTNIPVVPTGSTAFYDDPIAYGLALVGRPASNPAGVVDADVGAARAAWVPFLDLAEYRLIQNLVGSSTDVTESDFGRSASYNQLADRWARRASELMAQYKTYLNPYRVGGSSGTIRNQPPTAFAPRWGPGYGGPSGRGYGGYGGYGCGGY